MIPTEYHPCQVLVCDGSMNLSHAITRIIKKSGMLAKCTIVEKAAVCVSTLSRFDFDLAFVDVDMLNANGEDIITLAHRSGVRALFVAVSSRSSEACSELGRSKNVFAFLQKPASEKKVLEILETYRRVAEPRHVLAIDGEHRVRAEFEHAIHSSLFHLMIDVADGPESAIALFRRKRHDIVFIDINLPSPGTADVMMKLKSLNAKVEFILVSDNRGVKHSGSGRGEISDHLLHKPFMGDDVERILDDLIKYDPPQIGEQSGNLVLL